MTTFKQFLTEYKQPKQDPSLNIIVEAFDPAKVKGEYAIENIGGVEVVLIKKKGVNSDSDVDTVIINQKDLKAANSSFCRYNPKINSFAKSSPENMFFVLALVVGTIGISWGQFRNLFPVYVAYVRATDGKPIDVDSIVGLDGKTKKVAQWFARQAPKYIRGIWRNREKIYDDIYGKGLNEDAFELYRYINFTISGMSTVKAAFAVQLLTGKLGCIDNINADIYGIPVDISKPDGKTFVGAAFRKIKNKETGKKEMTPELTPGGKKILNDYISFLNAIGRVTKSEFSQRLWDDWVQLAAAKSIFAQSHKQIKFQLVDGRVIVMPTYSGATNDPEYGRYLQNVRKQGIDPFGGVEIGREHFTLPKTASEIDVTDAKQRITPS